jgi:nucleotide-binding universal stress UspA family protein
MRILLAVEDSKYSEAAVRDVAEQTRAQNAEFLVLHVIQPISVSSPPQMASGYAPELEEQKKQARDLVERLARTLRRGEFKVETGIATGDVGEKIIERAAEWHADLIVLGSHGRRGASRLLLGSVTEFVARHAPCSVKIVRIPSAECRAAVHPLNGRAPAFSFAWSPLRLFRKRSR